jgi:histidyl-tRNA synthetase
MSKTQPARGMRDFLPSDVRKREYVIGVIKEVYQKYGFEPLETPSVENLEILTGKYGEDEKLIYKILKRGEKLNEQLTEFAESSELQSSENSTTRNSVNSLSDLALRYDLTVPLARVVANYKDKLPKFFKRYQIQPVWRADRPARGRYREFYQCDVDAIGSKSMIVEAELISAVCEILERLEFKDFVVKLNHRKVLTGILEVGEIPPKNHTNVLIALDKIDKIGRNGVVVELVKLGMEEKEAEGLLSLFKNIQDFPTIWKGAEFAEGLNLTKKERLDIINEFYLTELKPDIAKSNEGTKGFKEIETILQTSKSLGVNHIQIDPTLARGLSYYTGAIFEIVLTNGDFAGSIGGGGRYDGLIGMFGKEEIPACGFSLGLERILVVMEERGMFPESLQTNSADVMITIWNEESIAESLKLANDLRATGLRVLVYPEADKLGKQFKYAGSINVPYVCILGENELAENKVAVKNMTTGEQEIVVREEVASKVKSKK